MLQIQNLLGIWYNIFLPLTELRKMERHKFSTQSLLSHDKVKETMGIHQLSGPLESNSVAP